MQGDWYLERAIFDTIRFYSLLEMPMTLVQIWRSLVVAQDESGQRWHGHHVPSLKDVRYALDNLELKRKVGSCWGYYWLPSTVISWVNNREPEEEAAKRFVRRRLVRHAVAQQKWKIARRVGWWLNLLPLVEMIGGSGSLVWFNTHEQSDIDVFVIVKKVRICSALALLLLVSQLSGRRRKYWDEISPDKICLNHYIADGSLLMDRAVRNIYMAQQYNQMVPLSGLEVFSNWWEANRVWLRQYVISPERRLLKSRLYMRERGWQVAKKQIESWLLEVPGDWLEKILRGMQLWAIKKHEERLGGLMGERRHDRVVLSDDELAFHPHTKEPMILKRYYEEEGQGTLL